MIVRAISNLAKQYHRYRLTLKDFRQWARATVGTGGTILHSFGTFNKTSKDDMVKKYRQWQFVCARLNAINISATPLRVFATRGTGEAKARRKAKSISRDEYHRLASIKNIGGMPKFKAAEEVEEIIEHPLLSIINDELLELTSLFTDLTGDSYWYTPIGPLGVPTEALILYSQWTDVVYTASDYIKGYLYGRNPADRLALKPEEVVNFRNPNPIDPFRGMGCVEASIRAIDLYTSYEEYEKGLADNQARPDIYIQYKAGNIDPKQRRKLEKEWNSIFQGKAGKALVTDNEYDIKELGFSPKEMANLKGRDWTLKEIAAAFGVPVVLLDTGNVNKTDSQIADKNYKEYGITPRLRRIENKINQKLAPIYDERLFVAFDNVVPQDKEFNLKQEKQDLEQCVKTINEIRSSRGMEPVEYGDVPYATRGKVPLGSDQVEPSKEPKEEKVFISNMYRMHGCLNGKNGNGRFSDRTAHTASRV